MHSFTSCLMHCVWATKERRPLIKPELQSPLALPRRHHAREQDKGIGRWWRGGLCSRSRFDSVHAFGGKVYPTLERQLIQMDSRHVQGASGFLVAGGYGAFSIGISGVGDTTKYIESQ